VGLPITDDPLYLVMEVHYDNPNQLKIVDGSGLRLWHTGQLRQYDAGITFYAGFVDPALTIPPQQQDYVYNTYCPSDCSTANLPPTGINVTGAILHAHLAATQIYFRQFRNGTELPPMFSEPYYDFAFQSFQSLPQERTILPGDSFQVECHYNTVGRTAPTVFGLGTHQEMCFAFILYYPALPLGNEYCSYGDYTGITSDQMGFASNKTIYCGSTLITDWNGPPAVIPYQAPPCNYTPPPSNMSTTPMLQSKLNINDYANNVALDPAGLYQLYWNVDTENQLLHAAVQVETNGWVGFGISPQGMAGSDVFIGWVKDGQVHFADRYAYQQGIIPTMDVHQDYYAISAGEMTTSPDKTKGPLSRGGVIGVSIAAAIVGLSIIVFVFWLQRRSHKGMKVQPGKLNTQEQVDPPSDHHHESLEGGEETTR